ncbi:MAG: LysE family translocator [Pseudomonadota bacterium]
MAFETWILFFVAYVLVTLSPGPNVLLVVTHAMRYGYQSILTVIAANLLCQLAIVGAVAAGVGALMTVDSVAFKAIKYLGATYLVFLGLKTIVTTYRDSANPLGSRSSKAISIPGLRQRLAEAFFVSAGNPKSVVFLAAFLPQFVDPSTSLRLQFSEMFLTIALIVLSIHALYAWLAVSVRKRVVDRRIKKGTSYASGGLFVALGAGLSTKAPDF